MRLPHSFVLLELAVLAASALTNTTIDDSSSSFAFTGSWNTITPASPCSICSSDPNASLVHDGTWHDGNIRLTAVPTTGSFTFQGSAVYIFGIDQAISQPDITFTLGSIQSVHHYEGTEQFVYNALFFSASGLASDQTHTVNWEFVIDNSTGVQVQVALFDYAIVTSGDEEGVTTTTTGTPSSTTVTPSSTTGKPSRSGISQLSASRTLSPTGSTPSSVTLLSSSQSATSSSNGTIPSALIQGQTSSQTITVDGSTTVTAQAAIISSHSKSNLGAIVGGVVGALVVSLLVILFLFLRQRSLRRMRKENEKTEARSQFLRLEDYPFHTLRNSAPSAPPQVAETREAAPSLSRSATLSARTKQGSSVALLSSTASSPTNSPQEVVPPIPNTRPTGTDSVRSSNYRHLEERLATLEAQVADQGNQPPPYIHED